jgi:hypothetical protein
MRIEELEKNLKECIDQKTQIERRYIFETEELNKRIATMKLEYETKGMQIEVLTKKLARRQYRVKELKKVLEEMAEKVSLLDQRAVNIAREKEILTLQLKQWQPLEKLKYKPEELLELVHRKANSSIFGETGSLEGDIYKLKSVLTDKLREYSRNTNKKRSMSCEGINIKLSKNTRNLNREIENLIEECSFKTKESEMQVTIDEHKAKIATLERKEKLLNKLINSSVFSFHYRVV